jgi:dTDP-4-dehydrorhamnose 3,5-epimerase
MGLTVWGLVTCNQADRRGQLNQQESDRSLKIQSPPITSDGIATAFKDAKANVEPVFVPATAFADDRGWSIMNQLQGVMDAQGQVNYSVMYPQVIKAWHRHHRQTDFWLCLMGHLKVGVHREEDGATWQMVMGQMKVGVLIIPPPLWHGVATVGPDSAGLLYYVTHTYDSVQPDEDRRDYGSIAGFNWDVQHK